MRAEMLGTFNNVCYLILVASSGTGSLAAVAEARRQIEDEERIRQRERVKQEKLEMQKERNRLKERERLMLKKEQEVEEERQRIERERTQERQIVVAPPARIHGDDQAAEGGGSNGMFIRCDKNFLELQQQRHSPWLFGGLAELIHNAYDHGQATELRISVFQDAFHKEEVLELRDNGIGMPEEIIKTQLFSFGKAYDTSKRDEGSGIGEYIHCTHTLYSYTVLMHYTHALYTQVSTGWASSRGVCGWHLPW
jgi:signal transduction histidine kinase